VNHILEKPIKYEKIKEMHTQMLSDNTEFKNRISTDGLYLSPQNTIENIISNQSETDNITVIETESNSINIDIDREFIHIETKHICDEVFIIEQDKSIQQQYLIGLKEHKIPYKLFLCTNSCINYVKNNGLLKCKKCLHVLV